MVSRGAHGRRWLPDLWPSLLLLALCLAGTAPAAANQPDSARPVDAWAFVLVIVAALAPALVRRRPAIALTANAVAVTAYLAAGYAYGPVLFTVPVTAYGAGTAWAAGRAGSAVAAEYVAILLGTSVKLAQEGVAGDLAEVWVQMTAWAAVMAAAYAVGAAVRVRRVATAGIRAEQARRAASEERLRMAQDLHDSIGHGLAVIAMQAGVALHVLDRDPASAREAMEAVKSTSREALDGLRVRLEELRSPAAAERRPGPGLADLDRLTERVRAGGVRLSVDVDSALPPLPSTVDAAAYRILQESLTNVLRHAGAATVWIRVRGEERMLSLSVIDSGPAGASAGGSGDGVGLEGDPSWSADGGSRTGEPGTGGSGVAGMRAQAEALHGSLHAAPRPGGGFAVVARLPLDGTEGGEG